MDIDLMQIVGTLIVGVGIPLLVQILKQVWDGVPSWLKTIAPIVVVPALGAAGVFLSGWAGIPVDFGPVIDIILGGVALGAASTMAFKMGKVNPSGVKAVAKAAVGAALLFALLVPAPASAQTFEAGASVLLNDDEAIDVSDARAFVSASGLDIPVPGNASTGVLVEVGYSTAVIWSLWSVNRTEMKRVIAGADVRIARGGPEMGTAFDVAFRIVGGYRVADHVAVYAYFLEDQTPFAFAVGWKF